LDNRFYKGRKPSQSRPRNTAYTKQLLELIRTILPYLDRLDDKFSRKDRDLMRAYLASNGDRIDTAIATGKSVRTVDNHLRKLMKKMRLYKVELGRHKKLAGKKDEEIICPHCRKRFRRERKD